MSSCCHNIDDNHSVGSDHKLSRHDEIRKIIVDSWIRDLESSDKLTAGEQDGLEKMKREKHKYLSDLEIRGPFTIEQVEQESLERIRNSSKKDVPQVPFCFGNDEWNVLKSKYNKGDVFYYLKTDERRWLYLSGYEGYVLIHNNEVLDMIIISMN